MAKSAVKQGRKRAVPSAEEIELAIAFFRAEVTHEQAAAALETPHRNAAATRLATVLRNAAAAGLVRITGSAK
jgi:hypothetical protein